MDVFYFFHPWEVFVSLVIFGFGIFEVAGAEIVDFAAISTSNIGLIATGFFAGATLNLIFVTFGFGLRLGRCFILLLGVFAFFCEQESFFGCLEGCKICGTHRHNSKEST